jgi:benzylsuccinate CoA-transferase BbsE subunit
MADLPPLDPLDPHAPLRDVRVLEVAGELSGYAGRLFADLGAEVTRVSVAADGAAREASLPLAEPPVDAARWFLHRGKHELALPADPAAAAEELARLIGRSDIVVQSGGADAPAVEALEPDAVRAASPEAIHVIVTPFGLDGPAADYVSADLVRLAAGGLLWLGGYPDAGPVAPFGGQSALAASIFAVVGALVALIERDRSGDAHTLEVSSQEVLTQALETSLPEYELTGRVQRRLGETPREAGSGVFPCRDGFVSMVAGRLGTAEAWTKLREWLVEAGTPGAGELLEAAWDDLEFRRTPEAISRFSELFVEFARERGKQQLYVEAQRRSIALSPVNSLPEVLVDDQLAARGFFAGAVDEASGARGLVPAPPYRLSPLGPEPRPLAAPDAAGAVVAPPQR